MSWKQRAVAVAFGLGGVLLGLGLWHGWQDHANLHALVNLVNQQAAQAAQQQRPPSPAPEK